MAEEPKETLNFRLPRSYRRALDRIAEEQRRTTSDVLRDAVARYIEGEERRAWEAEAERQSLAVARRAQDPEGEEAKSMEWIERVSDDLDWDT